MRLFISKQNQKKKPNPNISFWTKIKSQNLVQYLTKFNILVVLSSNGLLWNQCIPGCLHSQKTNLPTVLNPPPPPPPVGPQLPGGSLSSNPLGRKEHEAEAAWSACVRALSSCSWNERVKTIYKKKKNEQTKQHNNPPPQSPRSTLFLVNPFKQSLKQHY